jgi:hypothetical protein
MYLVDTRQNFEQLLLQPLTLKMNVGTYLKNDMTYVKYYI